MGTQQASTEQEPKDSDRRERWTVRAALRPDIRIFSSANDAPLSRRPTDVVLLVLSVVVITLLSFPAPGPTAIDTAVQNVVELLPGLFGWFWEIAYDVLWWWAVLLILLALFAHGRKRLVLYELLAGVLAIGFALVAGKIGGTDWPDSLDALTHSGKPPVYLAVRLAVATAVVVVASPHMSRPLRYLGRWVVGLGAIAGVALGTTLPIGMIAGFAIGIASAAIVHLFFGSPAGRPSLRLVGAALEDLGVEATDLEQLPLEAGGAALVRGDTPGGGSILVKIYGRDARDGQVIGSLWNSVWHRGETPHVLGRLQQVEHEAFVTLLAERGGVPVQSVVAAGMASARDAVLVTDTTGRPFQSMDAEDVDAVLLGRVWRAAGAMHDLDIAHQSLDDSRIVVRADGLPAIGDFSDAKIDAATPEVMSDRAQLLVATALVVGPERAAEAALAALGRDDLEQVIPFLQPAVLSPSSRRDVHDLDWSLDDLRKAAADHAGVDVPKLAQIRRVTLRSVAIVAIVALLAYAIISAIAGVGLDTLVDELKGANFAWLMLALLVAPTMQIAQAFATIGASIRPVRYVPVLMLQYSIQFIQLAVPSSAARLALEVRFFGRNGVDPGGAVSIGVIDSVCGFVVQLLLIAIISLSGLATLDLSRGGDTSSSESSSGPPLLLLALGLVLLGAVITLLVPKWRHRILEAIPKIRAGIKQQASSIGSALRVLRSPSKLAMIFGGNLVAQLIQALVLGLCLEAFGHHTSFAGLILVNTLSSLFAGFMPVPGGMGVAEAAYTAGLVGLGIPNEVALPTAITFRLVTYYLPPIWGAGAMRWLRKRSYL